ncbi:MAG: leucine-rich repeat protein, partial [Clostridiales Family XIII bacterium]|nr:leucine-rich repeat protein [Clostridiales Family XIII bacterium]
MIDLTGYTPTTIGTYAFAGTGAANAVIPSRLNIPTSLFQGCVGLATVSIVGNTDPTEGVIDLTGYELTAIGIYAFSGTGATKAIIPAKLSIPNYLFYNSASLTTVSIVGNADPAQGVIDLTDYTPTTIGTYAFAGTGATGAVLPTGLSISDRLFQNCAGLTTISIGENLSTSGVIDLTGYTPTTIGIYAFAGTGALKAVLPSGLNASNYLFQNANALADVEFLGATAPTIGTAAFPTDSKPIAYVPDKRMGGYELDAFAQHFSEVIPKVDPAVTGISVTTMPTKTEYSIGLDDALDLSGLVVTAAYEDELKVPVTGYTTDPAEGAALLAIGDATVTVNYEGKTTSFTVKVKESVIKVYMDFEGYNLGQGYYIEPTAMDIPGGTSAAYATDALLKKSEHKYANTGTIASDFYLSNVEGFGAGDAVPPAYLGEALSAVGKTLGTNADGWLGDDDYNAGSRWVFTVNGEPVPDGASARTLRDGDVVRWQFSVLGDGADIGLGEAPLYARQEKTRLIRALFEEGAELEDVKNAKAVIIDPLSTKLEVASAYGDLHWWVAENPNNNLLAWMTAQLKEYYGTEEVPAAEDYIAVKKLKISGTMTCAGTSSSNNDYYYLHTNAIFANVEELDLTGLTSITGTSYYSPSRDGALSLQKIRISPEMPLSATGGFFTYMPSLTTLVVGDGPYTPGVIDLRGYAGTFGTETFRHSIGVAEVRLPKGKAISDSMFRDCTGLTTVSIGDNVPTSDVIDLGGYASTIGTYAFAGSGAARVVVPSGLNLPNYMFQGCADLTTASVGDNVSAEGVIDLRGYAATLGTYAFAGSGATRAVLPAELGLPDNMFRNCTGLTTVSIGNSVPTQGVIDLRGYAPPSMGYGQYAFAGTGATRAVYPAELNLTSYMFQNCADLTTFSIGDNTPKEGVIDLTGYSRTTIPSAVFAGTGAMKAVIPAGLNISTYLFQNANALNSVAFLGTTAPTIGTSAFPTNPKPIAYIPDGTTSGYDVAAFTQHFSKVAPISSQPVLTGISITAPPSKAAYTVGESLDLTGLVVTAAYSDGSEASVTGYTTDPADGTALTEAGNVTVTVSYEGKTATFTVTATEAAPTLTGISITNQPTKKVYKAGDKLNLSGIVVTAIYSDERAERVMDFTSDPPAGTELSDIGDLTVTVTYEGKTATFTVSVEEAKAPDPVKVTYDASKQGVSAAVFALIALDSGGYAQDADGVEARAWYLSYLLSRE